MVWHCTAAHARAQAQVHNVCTRGNRAEAQLAVEQSERRSVRDWGGGTIVLWDGRGKLGQV